MTAVPETYLPLEDAAKYEGVNYEILKKRIQRAPSSYCCQKIATGDGGKDRVLVGLSSLSAKARKAYKAAQRVECSGEAAQGDEPERPWYVDADLNAYIEGNERRYLDALDLSEQIGAFVAYDDAERTRHAEQTAARLGISARTLYRYTQSYLEGSAWAQRMERERGCNYDYFRVLALCRKPKEANTFPSLPPEQRAVVENIWFNPDFANNLGTVELLYDGFVKEAKRRGWEEYPSIKTVGRYVNYLMTSRGAASARYLAANGTREWKRKMELKCKRDASTLQVMEYVVADAHTFDLWVSYTTPNGKVKAIRPVLVAWEDMRSRCILGPVMCEHSTAQVVKESAVKMVYSALGGVPQYMHMDNGKDFTAKENLGQDRSQRAMERVPMDAEVKGFFRSLGVQEWSRSLPYQPWDKPIERAFNTFCLRHSRKYKSYVGTLTGSNTDGKRKKDIDGMLQRGELLTLEEFYAEFQKFLDEDYHVRPHRGLIDAGEPWRTPLEVFEHAPRYEKAAPPREFAAMLLMKASPARVNSQGITKFKTLYTAYELCHYEGQTVGVKWDMDDVTRLYVYDKDGRKICEAVSAELLQFGPRVSQAALEELHRKKNRQLAETRALLEDFITPYEERAGIDRAPEVAGKIDLMIAHPPRSKAIALPDDKEYRGSMAAKRKKTNNQYFVNRAAEAMKRLEEIG